MCKGLAEMYWSNDCQSPPRVAVAPTCLQDKWNGALAHMCHGRWVHFNPNSAPHSAVPPMQAPGVYSHIQINHGIALAFIMHSNTEGLQCAW